MPELKDTIDKLGRAFEEFKAENDKRLEQIEAKGSADPLSEEKLAKIENDLNTFESMKAQIETLENDVGRLQLPGGTGDPQRTQAQHEHGQAFRRYVCKGADAGLRDLEVKAALSTLSDPDGGFTVPEQVEAGVDRVASTISAIRRLARVISISAATYKKLTSKGGAAGGWVAEKGSRTETDTPTLAEIAIDAKELYAMPAATQTLLDDSSLDIEAWLADEIGETFGDYEGPAFVEGNGVEKAKGITAYSTVANASYTWGKVGYIASGHASQLNDPDALIDLQDALPAKYQAGAAFVMKTGTKTTIRKLKDGEGRYIWQPGLAPGEPNLLLGKPLELDDNMPAVAAGKYAVAYANWKRAYTIIDVRGIRVLRDPYSSKPYVLFYTTKRVGAGITMYEAIKLLKIAAS